MAFVGAENGKYGCYRTTKGGSQYFIPMGTEVNVKDVFRNIETEEYFLSLEYLYDGFPHIRVIPREDLNSRGLLKYAKYGMDVSDSTSKVLVDYLRKQEEIYLVQNQTKNRHSSIGWLNIRYDGKYDKYFFHSDCNDLTSFYDGDLDIQPSGEFIEWKEDVEKLILGNIPMETVVVIALSAVLFGYYREEKDIMNPIVNLVGDSSCGKSTALMAGIATAGNPSLLANGLAKSWKGTDNALISGLKKLHGIPVGRDELSMYTGANLSDLVYQISMGKEKERLDKEYKLMSSESFTTVLLSTGETGILTKCSGNSGLNIRVIELKADYGETGTWTLSANNSEEVKLASLNHYGTACREFATIIKSMDEEELEAYFQEYRELYLQNTTVKKFQERTSLTYALFLMTAVIMKEKADINFDVEGILRFLIRNEQESSKDFNRDLGYRFYDKFKEYVWTHRGNFVENTAYAKKSLLKDNENKYAPKWGVIKECAKLEKQIEGKDVLYEVSVRKYQFDKIVQELGFEDTKNILRNLKEKKILNADSDRYTRGRKIDSERTEEVYVMWFDSELAEADETEEALKQIVKEENMKAINRAKERKKKLRVTLGNLPDEDGNPEEEKS